MSSTRWASREGARNRVLSTRFFPILTGGGAGDFTPAIARPWRRPRRSRLWHNHSSPLLSPVPPPQLRRARSLPRARRLLARLVQKLAAIADVEEISYSACAYFWIRLRLGWAKQTLHLAQHR